VSEGDAHRSNNDDRSVSALRQVLRLSELVNLASGAHADFGRAAAPSSRGRF